MQLFPLLVGGQSACLLKVQWSLGLFGFIVAENYSPSVWFGFRTDSIGINKEWIGDSVEWADDVLLWKPDKHRVPTAKSPTTKRSRKHSNQHIREFLHFNAQKNKIVNRSFSLITSFQDRTSGHRFQSVTDTLQVMCHRASSHAEHTGVWYLHSSSAAVWEATQWHKAARKQQTHTEDRKQQPHGHTVQQRRGWSP